MGSRRPRSARWPARGSRRRTPYQWSSAAKFTASRPSSAVASINAGWRNSPVARLYSRRHSPPSRVTATMVQARPASTGPIISGQQHQPRPEPQPQLPSQRRTRRCRSATRQAIAAVPSQHDCAATAPTRSHRDRAGEGHRSAGGDREHQRPQRAGEPPQAPRRRQRGKRQHAATARVRGVPAPTGSGRRHQAPGSDQHGDDGHAVLLGARTAEIAGLARRLAHRADVGRRHRRQRHAASPSARTPRRQRPARRTPRCRTPGRAPR